MKLLSICSNSPSLADTYKSRYSLPKYLDKSFDSLKRFSADSIFFGISGSAVLSAPSVLSKLTWSVGDSFFVSP